MLLKVFHSLQKWVDEVNGTYITKCSPARDLEFLSKNTGRSLRQYGFTNESIAALMLNYGKEIEYALGIIECLYVLVWYWPNGEELLFPVNEKGSIYIGNMPKHWLSMYPFLRSLDSHNYKFECSLDIIYTSEEDFNLEALYIGGQSHFGHFCLDTIAPLVELSALLQGIAIKRIACSPMHKKQTKELIMIFLEDLERSNNMQYASNWSVRNISSFKLGGESGIYKVGKAIVPSNTHSPGSLVSGQRFFQKTLRIKGSKLDETTYATQPKVSHKKIAYLSRNKEDNKIHDRIGNYQEFKKILDRFGVKHICPEFLDIKDRVKQLSQYDLVISDSGSCELNAFMFTRPNTRIYSIRNERVLSQTSESELAFFYKQLPLIGNTLFSIKAKPSRISKASSWYDIVEVDLKQLFKILEKS